MGHQYHEPRNLTRDDILNLPDNTFIESFYFFKLTKTATIFDVCDDGEKLKHLMPEGNEDDVIPNSFKICTEYEFIKKDGEWVGTCRPGSKIDEPIPRKINISLLLHIGQNDPSTRTFYKRDDTDPRLPELFKKKVAQEDGENFIFIESANYQIPSCQ